MKKNTIKGWKVLNEYRESITQTKFSIHYTVNETVTPSLKGSKLFFFRYKKDAMKFKPWGGSTAIIVRCIATNYKPIDVRAYFDSTDNLVQLVLTRFWEEFSKNNNMKY